MTNEEVKQEVLELEDVEKLGDYRFMVTTNRGKVFEMQIPDLGNSWSDLWIYGAGQWIVKGAYHNDSIMDHVKHAIKAN